MTLMKTPWRVAGGFLLSVLAGVWLVWGPFGIVCYVGGLFNSMPAFMLVSLAMLPALVFAGAFPVLIVRAVVTWRRSTLVWLVLTGGFFCPYAWGFAGWTVSPFDMFVRGFRRYAERRVDVEAIRDWLDAYEADGRDGEHDSVDRQLAKSEQPACIAKLAPKFATVLSERGERSKVRLLWGGGFIGHWGVMVGPIDMPTPPSDTSKGREQRYPLSPGAYVWSGN
jgi:hypothetical protein